MNRSRTTRWVVLAAFAAALAGCESRDASFGSPKARPGKRLTPQDFEPRIDVRKVVLAADGMCVEDTDNDGVPDTIPLQVLLFPSPNPGPAPVIGRGSFRFEIFDANEPAATRQPLSEAYEYTFKESLECMTIAFRSLPAYTFRLRLKPMTHVTTQLTVRGTFFPEDGGDDLAVVSSGVSVQLTSIAAVPPREALRPWSPVTSRPDVITIKPHPRPEP